jgi:hypothetical protein
VLIVNTRGRGHFDLTRHAQTDLGHAAIRDRADVGSLAARVNAEAIATLCGNIKAARPTLTPHPCAVVPVAHNLRVHPVTRPERGTEGRRCSLSQTRRSRHCCHGRSRHAPSHNEFSAAAKTSDDAAPSHCDAIRVIVRTVPDFTSLER